MFRTAAVVGHNLKISTKWNRTFVYGRVLRDGHDDAHMAMGALSMAGKASALAFSSSVVMLGLPWMGVSSGCGIEGVVMVLVSEGCNLLSESAKGVLVC